MSYESYERDSIDTIEAASAEHGGNMYVMASFGHDAALGIHLAKKAGLDKVLTIDTGFWFPETHEHRQALEELEGFKTTVIGPTHDDIDEIERSKLWETDIEEYNRITKLQPLTRAIGELGITALVTGVRADQTANRTSLLAVQPGNDEEVRINPVLQWTDELVDDYFAREGLPYHPLYHQGYGSIGDWTLTRPGQGREGRDLGEKSECGLHIFGDASAHSVSTIPSLSGVIKLPPA